MVKDMNGKEIAVGDFIKFKPHEAVRFVIGRVQHLDKHHIPKRDADGDFVQKKKGGVETEEKTGQVLYFRANTTEHSYFNPAEVEVVLKADGSQPTK